MAKTLYLNSTGVEIFGKSNIGATGSTTFNTTDLPKNGGMAEIGVNIMSSVFDYGTVSSVVVKYKAYGTRTGALGSKAQIQLYYWDGSTGAYVKVSSHGDVGRGSSNATPYTDTAYPYYGSGIKFLFKVINPIAAQTNKIYVSEISFTINYTSGYFEVITIASPTEGGTITGGGTYVGGTQITLTATPNAGYKFLEWNGGVTTTEREVTVTGDATYTAYFEKLPAPKFTSASMTYLNKQISEKNKVIHREGFIISASII